MDRRKFLKNIGLLTGAGTVSMALGNVPVRAFARSFMNIKAENGKVLVLLQMSGGNDGLNTVIPFEDSNYYKVRPTIGIRQNDAVRLTSNLGLNPGLAPFESLYKEGKLSVIQNVGYANPDRSHFRSTDIWLTASDSNQYINDGWVGRFLAKAFPDYPDFDVNHPMAIQLGSTQSTLLECTCQGSMGLSFEDPNRFYQLINGSTADNDPPPPTLAGEQLKFIKQVASQSVAYATIIKEKADTVQNKVEYPNTQLGRQLSIIAKLIGGGLETPVYLTSIGGFDTHTNQLGGHQNLLNQIAIAVSAFQRDLEQLNVAQRVVLMTFSEFGRRVEQNGSGGTDHGTAAPLFLVGSSLKGGIVGNNPDLDDLDNNGDLKYQFDFRQIYATLLQDHLNMSADRMPEVLFRNFETLPLLDVKPFASGGPVAFELRQNYPNPFNPDTKITYHLRQAQNISLKIFDALGSEVVTLHKGYKEAGIHTVTFGGGKYPSGIYYCRLASGSFKQTIKMMLLK